MYLKIQSHTCIKTLQIPETHNVKEKGANIRNPNYSGGHLRLQAIYKALYVELSHKMGTHWENRTRDFCSLAFSLTLQMEKCRKYRYMF